jgi:hypothetical protein
MPIRINTEVTIEAVNCCACGTPFGIEATLNKNLLASKGEFYCPNGHPQHYTGESLATKAARLEKELEAARQDEQWWKQRANKNAADLKVTKSQLRGTKAALTRTKKRVANGVCPCCNRSFTNLQRHMSTKHPEYVAEAKDSE